MLLVISFLFTVICGHHQPWVFLDLNIICLFLDDYSHYLWTFPCGRNLTLSPLWQTFSTQFGTMVKTVQCDNGREFNNSSSCTFFLANDIHLHMSCPYTTPRNSKAEHICIIWSLVRWANTFIKKMFLPITDAMYCGFFFCYFFSYAQFGLWKWLFRAGDLDCNLSLQGIAITLQFWASI